MVSNTGNQEEISIDDALNKIGVGFFHYRVSIIGGLILLSSYLSVGVVTFFMPAAQCDLGMKSEQKGYLAAISFVGLILSAHLWGFLSDTLGRRYIIIRCLLCDGLLYFITMLTSSYYIILVLRFFNGVASCGGVVSVYAYVGEFQPTQFRPRSLMIVSLVATLAYIFLPAAAWLTIPSKWAFELYPGLILKSWRLFYIVNGIPSILSVILLLFMPESPKFLVAKGENEKAVEVLRSIYKSKNNNNDDNFTINNIKSNERIGKIRDDKSKIMAFFFLMWDQTIPLLKKPHLFNFLLLSLSLFTTFFCNNGMYIWLPVAINKMSIYEKESGKDVGTFCDLTQYVSNQSINPSKETELIMIENESYTSNMTTNLFKAAEETCIEDIDTSVYNIFMVSGSCQILSWIIIVIIIKYFHKKYLLFGITLCAVATVISLKIPNQLITVPIKSSLIVLFTAAIFPIINSLVVDFFPTNLRAMAGCLTLLISRIGTVSTNLMTGILIDKHCDILIWLHICSISICALAIICLPSSSAGLGKEQKRPSKTEEV